MGKAGLVAIGALMFATAVAAEAQDRKLYFGVGVGTAAQANDFGGFNTVGGFSNEDSQSSNGGLASLTLGLAGMFNLGSASIDAEIEAQRGAAHDTVSASFPGLPSPTFFYDSRIESRRLGVNLWAPISSGAAWTFQGGLGLGIQRTHLQSSDTVVGTDSTDTAAYGMLGLRALHPIGNKGRLAIDLRYFKANETSHPLTEPPFSAGELTHAASGVQVMIGYQFDLGG